MTFAALAQLNRLRARRDIAVHLAAYRTDGGVVVETLDISRPVSPATVPVWLTILPDGQIACGSAECETWAA